MPDPMPFLFDFRYRHANLLAVLLCLLAIPSVARAAEASASDSPPNVIMIMSDDQGWGDVGFNGNAEIKTPHLDAMAANGVKFDRFYAASSICSPTRASCLTGRIPYRMGVLAAHTGGMRVGEITVAEALKDQGYRTGFFGKWHVGWVKPDQVGSRGFYSPPWHHGYDETFATTSAVPTWDPTVTPDGWNSWGQKENTPWKEGTPYVLNGKDVTDNLDGDDSRIIMDRVIPFIEADRDTPFFATVWFHAPTNPSSPDRNTARCTKSSTRPNSTTTAASPPWTNRSDACATSCGRWASRKTPSSFSAATTAPPARRSS